MRYIMLPASTGFDRLLYVKLWFSHCSGFKSTGMCPLKLLPSTENCRFHCGMVSHKWTIKGLCLARPIMLDWPSRRDPGHSVGVSGERAWPIESTSMTPPGTSPSQSTRRSGRGQSYILPVSSQLFFGSTPSSSSHNHQNPLGP